MEIEIPTWVRNVGVLIAVGLIIWLTDRLYNKVDDLGDSVVRLDEASRRQDQRITSIADRLSDAGVYVAREQFRAPVNGIMVTSVPQQVGNAWKVYTLVLNVGEQEQSLFAQAATGSDDIEPSIRVTGAIERLGVKSETFADMVSWSRELDREVSLVDAIDAKASYVFREEIDPRVRDRLFEIFGEPTIVPATHIDKTWLATADYANDQAVNIIAEYKAM